MSSPDANVQKGAYGNFRYEIVNARSTTATVKIHIPEGESIKAIPGCMFATSSNVEIKGKIKKTLRALVGPDEARYQVISATGGDGWVLLAPSFLGSITAVEIKDEEICVGDDAFLAGLGELESSSKSQGIKKAMFSGSGLFIKKVKGTGVIFVCAVGSMLSWTLADGESMVVDNGHLVTWPDAMQYDVKKASKTWLGSSISGEGVVTKVTGPGVICVQTRNAEEIAGWVYGSKAPPTTAYE